MKKGEGYFLRLKNLFWHPKDFLNSVSDEKKYSKILFFYVKIAVIAIVLNFIFAVVRLCLAPEVQTFSFLVSLVFTIFLAILSVGFAFATPFVASAVAHLGILVFRGRQGYFNTYKPISFSTAIGEIYQIIIVLFSVVVFFIFGNLALESMGSFGSFWIISAIYFVLFLISVFHVLYAEIIGVSKYQKISKLRAFLGIIFVPLILLILGIIIFFVISVV